MNWRSIATALGCTGLLAGGAFAASQYFGPVSPPPDSGQPPALFLMAAQKADPKPSWPPSTGPVAFNNEMIALLTMGATVRPAIVAQHQEPAREIAEPQAQGSRQERRRARQEDRARQRAERALAKASREARNARAQASEDDQVEVSVRDRNGNPLRVRRVQREFDSEPPRASAPGPFRMFQPFGDW